MRSTALWKKDFCNILCIGRLSGVGLRQTQWLQVLGSMNLESFTCTRLWLDMQVLLGMGQTEGTSHQINMACLLVHQLTYIMVENTKFTWSFKSQHKGWNTFRWAFWNYLGLTTQVMKGSRWLRGKRICLQCRRCKRCQRCRFDPWVGKIPWRRKWQPTPVFLLRKCHGRRSLMGCSP